MDNINSPDNSINDLSFGSEPVPVEDIAWVDDTDDLEMERICQNCSSFFQDAEDCATGLGVCMKDPVFNPFCEAIVDSDSFESCWELYEAKRFDGSSQPCEKFEMVEIMTDEEYDEYVNNRQVKETIAWISPQLHSEDPAVVTQAVTTLCEGLIWRDPAYVLFLREYYHQLPPADTLADGEHRIMMLQALTRYLNAETLTEILVLELYRSPSNNTTRQMMTKILRLLRRLPLEIIQDPLLDLLENKKFSPKFKKRIQDLTEEPELGPLFFF